MTFADEKLKPSSDRYVLVRMNPVRNISNGFTSIGFGVWTQTMPEGFIPSKVETNGVELLKVVSVSNYDEWSFDESTRVLTIRIISVPSSPSGTIIIAHYYLFFTQGVYRDHFETPDDDATPNRQWSPRLEGSPKSTQSVSNTTSGVFSLSQNEIRLLDGDGFFADFIGDEDSFNLREIAIWIVLNGEIERIFSGKCKRISRVSDVVSVQVQDGFTSLTSPAYFGDSIEECFFLKSDYPDIAPSDDGKPIKLVLAKTSKDNSEYLMDIGGGGYARTIASLELATCTDVAGSTFRDWALCRTLDQQKTLDFGTSRVITSLSTTRFQVTCDPGSHNLIVDDIFKATNGIKTFWAKVYYVSGSEYRAGFSNPGGGAGVGPGYTFTSHSHPMIMIESSDGSVRDYLKPDVDYTSLVTTTSGGNKFTTITIDSGPLNIGIADNFVNADISPTTHKVGFRIQPASQDILHGSIVERILNECGINADAASIAAANASLDQNVCMSVPGISEGAFGNYLSYLQSIIASTFAYLYLNGDGTAFYNLIAPIVSSQQIGSNLNLRRSMSYSIDYNDLVNEMSGSNKYNASADALAAGLVNYSASLNRTRFLHGINKSIIFEHVLEEISSRLDAILGSRGNRSFVVNISTATENIDALINDDFTAILVGIPGGSKDFKIVSISKSAISVEIQGRDLLGVP